MGGFKISLVLSIFVFGGCALARSPVKRDSDSDGQDLPPPRVGRSHPWAQQRAVRPGPGWSKLMRGPPDGKFGQQANANSNNNAGDGPTKLVIHREENNPPRGFYKINRNNQQRPTAEGNAADRKPTWSRTIGRKVQETTINEGKNPADRSTTSNAPEFQRGSSSEEETVDRSRGKATPVPHPPSRVRAPVMSPVVTQSPPIKATTTSTVTTTSTPKTSASSTAATLSSSSPSKESTSTAATTSSSPPSKKASVVKSAGSLPQQESFHRLAAPAPLIARPHPHIIPPSHSKNLYAGASPEQETEEGDEDYYEYYYEY